MSRRTRSAPTASMSGSASRQKRRHTDISYKEPDSDDDYGQESDTERRPSKIVRKSTRAQATRSSGQNSQAKQPRRNSTRKSQRNQGRRNSVWSVSKALATSRLSSVDTSGSFQETDIDTSYRSTGRTSPSISVPWNTLEYDILFDIFTYAFGILKEDKKPANTWLINTARTCKAFEIPALAALYQCPPLGNVEAARGFLAATSDKPEFYKAKVKHIQIEAIPTLTRKDKSQESISLEGILERVPNIRSLAAELHEDDPSSKRSVVNFTSRNRVNVYRPAMVDVMTKNRTRLQSMRWNYFFNSDQSWPWCVLADVHKGPCMQTIENLEILWLNVFTKQINKTQHVEALVEGIKALPSLKSLTFSLCNLFSTSESFLMDLPSNLESLTLIDCDDLKSEALTSFLSSHGGNLRHLNLSHNRHLDLGFMQVLRTACPRLESFKVDISCYGLMLTSTDSEPSFSLLLPDGIIPTWPESLRRVEMSYLRKWGRDAATIFFQSLVDSAKDLLSLRHLVIKTTVDLDWRDRVAFRDEWTQRLQKVFKRKHGPPRVEHTVSKQINGRITGAIRKPSGAHQASKGANGATDSIAGRLRRRSQDNIDHGSSDGANEHIEKPNKHDQGSHLSKTSRSLSVQGLCNVVEIRIENLRPMETQYAERDFMDEEISGDEDWTGEDSHAGESYAW